MSVSDGVLLHHLSRLPFADTAEPATLLSEAHAPIHRRSSGLLG